MTHLRNILFALAAFIVFAPLPARAAFVFIANVNPASFDVIAEFSPVRPDLLFGLDGRPLDNTAQLLTPDSPRKVHWFRARLQELPGTEFVNFAFSNSQETWSLLLPQTAAPPSAGPLVLNTNVRNALGGQMYVGSGIALVRLSKNGVKSAFSATFLTSDQQQLNISVSSLPSLYGSLDASGELMSGPDMRVRPGSRVELLVLSNARPTITFSALIHDPSGSDIQPSLPDLQFDLAPPDLDAPSSSNTKEATITWLRPPDTSGYELQRRGDADSEWTTIADISNPNTLQHTDQVAENGVYHYRARTVSTSPSAESAWSTPLTVNFAEAPVQVPSILQSYEVNSSNWTFSWPEVPGEDGVTYEYEIQWSRDPSFSDYSSLITSTPSATVPLAGQGTWYVRVRAILPGTPHLSGGWSTTATVTLALGTPELFVPLSTSSPSLFVNWSAVEPIPAGELLSYEVQLSDSSEFNNTLNGFTGDRTSTRLWLGNRGTWFLRVRALAGGNTGNWSQTAAVSFVPGDVSAPRELTAYPSTSEVRLHWTVSYPPDTYHTIYRAQEDGNFEVIGDLIQGDSFLDSTVSQFTKYSYRVVATDGNSEFESALVTTRTPAQTGFSGSVATSSAFSSGYAFLASASDSTDRIQLLRSPAAAQPSYSIALNDVANSANMTRSSEVEARCAPTGIAAHRLLVRGTTRSRRIVRRHPHRKRFRRRFRLLRPRKAQFLLCGHRQLRTHLQRHRRGTGLLRCAERNVLLQPCSKRRVLSARNARLQRPLPIRRLPPAGPALRRGPKPAHRVRSGRWDCLPAGPLRLHAVLGFRRKVQRIQLTDASPASQRLLIACRSRRQRDDREARVDRPLRRAERGSGNFHRRGTCVGGIGHCPY
ncbi:MAG: hypothetical protein U5N86_04070 [Planctomycetota bacterium]|nr:hypothetical protein [Planctomycetota bacterium]